MGAAEGTKMDDDFVEMERVSYLTTLCLIFSQGACSKGNGGKRPVVARESSANGT